MAVSKKGSALLKVFKALEAHPIIGISNRELADGLEMSPTNISRHMDDLIAEGLAVRLDNGNYAYSIKTLQIAERFRRQQEQLKSKIEEIGRRVDVE